jgi:hypothetical protein
MSGSTHESASCSCGQVVFDVTGRNIGEILSCPWCRKEYRYLGSNTIAPFAGEEEEGQSKGGAHAGALEAGEAGGGLGERMKAHLARRKQEPAAGQDLKGGKGGEGPKGRAKVRRREVPGGALRMVAFIVISNAIALILLQVFFARRGDGSRTTPWGGIIPRHRIPWPELAALLSGHLCGFVAWACYVYQWQRSRKAGGQAVAPAGKKDAIENKT